MSSVVVSLFVNVPTMDCRTFDVANLRPSGFVSVDLWLLFMPNFAPLSVLSGQLLYMELMAQLSVRLF